MEKLLNAIAATMKAVKDELLERIAVLEARIVQLEASRAAGDAVAPSARDEEPA